MSSYILSPLLEKIALIINRVERGQISNHVALGQIGVLIIEYQKQLWEAEHS